MTARILLPFLILLSVNAIAGGHNSKPAVTVKELAPGIHVLMGMGGNIGVSSGEDGVFIIDDDMPPMATKVDEALRTIQDKPVSMVFNTHWHFDHTGGNEHFGKQGALIVAHDNVRQRMSTKQFSKFVNSEVPASPKEALPVVTFDQTISFHLNGGTIKAVHIPLGHTDGDSVLFFEEANIVHMGDLFFNEMYPVIDISAGGSVWGMVNAIDTVLPMLQEDTVIIPGHGPIAGIEELKAFQTMLKTVALRIELLIEDGKTVDEIIALNPTTNFDAVWAWDFMPAGRFTALIHDSLVANPRASED